MHFLLIAATNAVFRMANSLKIVAALKLIVANLRVEIVYVKKFAMR